MHYEPYCWHGLPTGPCEHCDHPAYIEYLKEVDEYEKYHTPDYDTRAEEAWNAMHPN